MAEEKKTVRKKIQAADRMNRIMADYFYGLNEAATTGSKKVAWCTSVGPAELLRAMGFAVHFPENHAAMLGATRMSTDMIPAANAIGYSPDICSYLTSDIGAYLKGITPLSKAYKGIESVPMPDVLVFNTNQCRDVQDWLAWYSRRLNVPSIGVSSPKNIKEVTDAHIDDVARQIEALVPALVKISGSKLDMDRLRETVSLSRECTELWKKVLETATSVPAPLTFFDGTIHMGPAVVLRGTQEAVDYYKVLLAELEQRIRNGEGAVDDEATRLYWEGMPIWGRLRQHSELFSHLRANVLALAGNEYRQHLWRDVSWLINSQSPGGTHRYTQSESRGGSSWDNSCIQIAVLGGLIEDSVNDAEDSVPGLDRVPGIGSLNNLPDIFET